MTQSEPKKVRINDPEDFEHIEVMEDGGVILAKPKSTLQDLADCPDYISVVGMDIPHRVGVSLFAVALEHLHYPPDTPKNNDYQLALVSWPETEEDKALWTVITVPFNHEAVVREIARKCGLRLAVGSPAIIGRHPLSAIVAVRDHVAWRRKILEGIAQEFGKPVEEVAPLADQFYRSFPMKGERVYTFEYESDSPIYKHGEKKAHRAEREILSYIFGGEPKDIRPRVEERLEEWATALAIAHFMDELDDA